MPRFNPLLAGFLCLVLFSASSPSLAATGTSNSSASVQSTRQSRAAAARALRLAKRTRKPLLSSSKSSFSSASSTSSSSSVSSDGLVDLGIELKNNTSSIYITFIERGSPADNAGLLPGDEIHEIEGREVSIGTSAEKVLAQLRGAKGSKVKLEIGRPQKGLMNITVTRAWVTAQANSRVEMKGETLLIVPEDLTQQGVTAIRNNIAALGKSPASVLIDLRKNPKGSIEGVTAFIGMFLPKGTHIAWLETKDVAPDHLFKNAFEKMFTSGDPLFGKGVRIGVLTHEKTYPELLLIADALARKGGKDVMVFTSSAGFAIGTRAATWTMRAPNGKDIELAPYVLWSLKEEKTTIGCKDTIDRTWCITGIDDVLLTKRLETGEQEKDIEKAIELMKY